MNDPFVLKTEIPENLKKHFKKIEMPLFDCKYITGNINTFPEPLGMQLYDKMLEEERFWNKFNKFGKKL